VLAALVDRELDRAREAARARRAPSAVVGSTPSSSRRALVGRGALDLAS
jgi:hypothetical protein